MCSATINNYAAYLGSLDSIYECVRVASLRSFERFIVSSVFYYTPLQPREIRKTKRREDIGVVIVFVFRGICWIVFLVFVCIVDNRSKR